MTADPSTAGASTSSAAEARFHAFERAGWEDAAAHYDAAFTRLTGLCSAPLLDALAVGAGTRVADLACGPGQLAVLAAARGARVTAVDFAPAMVALLRARHPALDARLGDVEALDLPDGAFDAAAMGFGLLHLARPERAMAEAHRILASGGRFAATVWAPPPATAGFAAVLDAVARHGRTDVPLPPGPPFFRFGDHAEFTRTLRAAGFSDVEVRTVPLIWDLADADEFIATMRRGTVRSAALLAAQAAEAQPAINAAIRAACAPHVSGGRLYLPMPAVLAVATR